MPRGVGVFIRTNGQYDGDVVWQDDLENNVRIIAQRHDTHDQDLANGIAECLPKSGLEPMLGNLQMGAFQIKNLANGALPADGAAFGQVVNAASFDETTRKLTLGRSGLPPLEVTIQSGGDNTIITTGVQEAVIGSGLNLTGASLGGNVLNEGNPKGTIELSNTGVSAGTYSNASVSVDVKGRITGITSGSGLSTNLSNQTQPTFINILSSTGSGTTLSGATPSSAGLVTNAAQTFAGDKTLNNGLAVLGGNVAMLNLPLTIPSTEGVIWNDGSVLRVVGQGQSYFEIPDIAGNNTWTAINTFNADLNGRGASRFGLHAPVAGVLNKGFLINSDGSLFAPNIPTSAASAVSGQIYSNAGVLTIKP